MIEYIINNDCCQQVANSCGNVEVTVLRIKLHVGDMTCAACSARVEKVSRAVTGVQSASVNLLKGTLILEADNDGVVPAVAEAVRNAGYQVITGEEPVKETQNSVLSGMKFRIIFSACFLVVLMYITMGHMLHLPGTEWLHAKENSLVFVLLQLTLTLPVVFCNRIYYQKGFKAIWHRSPNMDSLIAVGSAAALLYGIGSFYRMAWAIGRGQWEVVLQYKENLYFESAAMILTLITLGKFLEARAKGKTGDAIKQLMDLTPKAATVIRNGAEIVLPLEEITVGDIVVVRSGGSIPVDGTVLEGRAAVDQSALTGESVPVEKNVNDTVSAGTINTEGYLQIRTEKCGTDTTLAQVIRLVEEAGGSKAPIAKLADKIAGVFVPVVMGIALVTFAVWLITGADFEFAVNTAISVLVISCPCALGLATPVAIMVATGRAATMGILFKNAEVIESLQKVDTVVFDKTGTLTHGRPAVTDIIANSVSRDELLQIAASLEAKSEHPFAVAILNYADGISLLEAADYATLPGEGVTAIIHGTRYFGGNAAMMQKRSISVPEYEDLRKAGKTPLYFAREDGIYLGAIAAADTLRDDSAHTVAALRECGLRVIMLTGDNRKTALAIAENAGIQEVISDVLPADKAAAIRKLKESGGNVLMVGDGINDSPALAVADVGMAVGGGTDIAVESAGVVLMGAGLQGVYRAILLSRATVRNIRQNLFWAFFYNVLGIPLAAGVLYPVFGLLLTPMFGAAAMSMSSVFVVSNALRLRRIKPKLMNMQSPITTEETKEETIMETVLYVNGMMCPHCQARVENACKGVAGVTDAVVDLKAKNVTVTGNVSRDVIIKAITDAGYEVVE